MNNQNDQIVELKRFGVFKQDKLNLPPHDVPNDAKVYQLKAAIGLQYEKNGWVYRDLGWELY